MQSVIDAFSAEEVDSVRKIAQSVQVAWKKDFRPTISFFTIGTSTIGGSDIIKGETGVISEWNQYTYEDESDRVLSLAYERSLNTPIGGVTKALAEVDLDNTSGRYTPRYSGGSSALFTAVSKPRRPVIINAGFNFDGTDHLLPQFVGITTKAPRIDQRRKTVGLQIADFIDFLQNKFVDDASMFTGQRSDQVIETILTNLNFATSQYELDTGINIIPFGEFNIGDRFSDVINQIVQAENGHFYQDEEGKLRFETRQHWSGFPHFNVQRNLTTSQVIEARTPGDDHLINVVEVKSQKRNKQPLQPLINYSLGKEIGPTSQAEMFFEYEDPVLSVITPTNGGTDSYYEANTQIDGSGADMTSSVTIKTISNFARASKITFQNSSSSTVYLTKVVISGRPAKITSEIYVRRQDDSSVTAYEEQPYLIENPYIQDSSWANSLAQMILEDFSEPENLQELTIRAIPELQLGDLISWQGRHWRIFSIKTQLNPSVGFVQELLLLQRTIQNYFRIGISSIGGTDPIAP